MNDRAEQIRAVMADEAFVKSCIEAENEEAVQQLFAGKGIEMSLTEIELMKETVSAVADSKITMEDLRAFTQEGELSEDELEQAAGGQGLLDYFVHYYDNGHRILAWDANILKHLGTNQNVTSSLTGLSKAGIAGAVVVGAVGAVAVAQECGLDVVGGVTTGAVTSYNWVKDTITRW